MDLTGKLLIAMPGMGDPRFEHAVVYLCSHSDEGAMGLIVNKPSSELHLSDLLKQLDIPRGAGRDVPVHFGGPVEHGRGFVLHSPEYRSEGSTTLEVDDRFGLTATLNILEDMSRGEGPDAALLALGYAGWGAGQLDNEIKQGAWIPVDLEESVVFDTPVEDRWNAALAALGIDPAYLVFGSLPLQ